MIVFAITFSLFLNTAGLSDRDWGGTVQNCLGDDRA